MSFVRLGYRIPLKVARIDDNEQLVTSNFDITRVIENAKDLVTKEKVGKFKS
jgi:hypothetical protein